MSCGVGENFGASPSVTVTTKLQVSPVESVVVTAVEPMPKNEPEAGTVVAVPQLPMAESGEVKVTTAPSMPASLGCVMLLGQLSVQAGVVVLEAFVVSDALLSVARRSVVSLVIDAVSVRSVPF